MQSQWTTENGTPACKWSDIDQRARALANWMQQDLAMQGSYLKAVPNFAARSPFGGPSWFDPQYRTPQD